VQRRTVPECTVAESVRKLKRELEFICFEESGTKKTFRGERKPLESD
jgi:hypothetical protein